MRRREASINDVPIEEEERRISAPGPRANAASRSRSSENPFDRRPGAWSAQCMDRRARGLRRADGGAGRCRDPPDGRGEADGRSCGSAAPGTASPGPAWTDERRRGDRRAGPAVRRAALGVEALRPRPARGPARTAGRPRVHARPGRGGAHRRDRRAGPRREAAGRHRLRAVKDEQDVAAFVRGSTTRSSAATTPGSAGSSWTHTQRTGPTPWPPWIATAEATPIAAARTEFHEGTEFRRPGGRRHAARLAGRRGVPLAGRLPGRARQGPRGYRYLQVDALPTSRPILRRLGFVEGRHHDPLHVRLRPALKIRWKTVFANCPDPGPPIVLKVNAGERSRPGAWEQP